jgi:hypothetical protein
LAWWRVGGASAVLSRVEPVPQFAGNARRVYWGLHVRVTVPQRRHTTSCSCPVHSATATMSDYDDDYDDYDGDFFYVEEEYMAADDLAEHAVASPPPATCGDEDMQEDWDRFDYFNDIEYASDGYDDSNFQPHDVKGSLAGRKRKRAARTASAPGKTRTAAESVGALPGYSPVVWRSQRDRDPQPKMLDDDAQPYALFGDWRERLMATPNWTRGSAPKSPGGRASRPASLPNDEDVMEEEEDGRHGGDQSIPQEALLAALQRQIAAAGGPLSGMDPQQLLQYAMRMASGEGDGDDIAGEMADAMLEGEDKDEEDDADAEENLLSWVAQQRTAKQPKSPEAAHDGIRPPTPPSSEANRSVRVCQTTTMPNAKKGPLKRKADDDVDGESATAKKRVTRSFNAPTASSQAKAASTRTTRTKPGKRP